MDMGEIRGDLSQHHPRDLDVLVWQLLCVRDATGVTQLVRRPVALTPSQEPCRYQFVDLTISGHRFGCIRT